MPRTIGLLTALLSLCGADEAEDRWPLIFAAGEGDAAAVERLLAAGADVHQLSADGETALHVSAIKGDLRTAQLLLDAGADVNARTPRGSTIFMTPAMWTVYHGHSELMELLLTDPFHRGISACGWFGPRPLELAILGEGPRCPEESAHQVEEG